MPKQSRQMSRVDQLSRLSSGTSKNSSSGSNMNVHHRPSSNVLSTRLIKRELNDGQPSGQSLVSSDASYIGYVGRADSMSLQAIAGEWVDKTSAKMGPLTDDDLQKMINELKVILTGKSNGHPSEIICRCQDCFKLICQIIKSYYKACDHKPARGDVDLSIGNLSDNPPDDLSWIFEAIAKNSIEILQELYMNATKSAKKRKKGVENGEGGKLIAPQEDMHCSSEGHAQVQPLEQLQHLVGAGGAKTEHAISVAVPSSPNSLLRYFPSIPENHSFLNVPNLDIPNLSFHGTYAHSNNTTGATSPDQEQILADFFSTHPTVEAHINGLPESSQHMQRMTTLLYHLKFVKARDFDEAARAQVQEAWNDLTAAGCKLQDLEPAVYQALFSEAIRRRREKLTATIKACQDQLNNLPVQNPDDPFLQP